MKINGWEVRRYLDGRAEMWMEHTITGAISNPMGSLYRSADTLVSYPIELSEVLGVFVVANNGNAQADLVSYNNNSLTYHLVYGGSVSASNRTSFIRVEGYVSL